MRTFTKLAGKKEREEKGKKGKGETFLLRGKREKGNGKVIVEIFYFNSQPRGERGGGKRKKGKRGGRRSNIVSPPLLNLSP